MELCNGDVKDIWKEEVWEVMKKFSDDGKDRKMCFYKGLRSLSFFFWVWSDLL